MIEAIDVVLQVADVLANAHEKGVMHRDLKPENIMMRRGMRGVHAKVLDFGIARLMDAGTRLTVAGAIAGTPRYMSPEQVEGKEVDLRADIYSLGIVLFELLTGVQPFDGSTIAEILRKQAVEPHAAPESTCSRARLPRPRRGHSEGLPKEAGRALARHAGLRQRAVEGDPDPGRIWH